MSTGTTYPQYLGHRLVASVVALIAVGVWLIIARYDAYTASVIGWIAAAKAMEALGLIPIGLFQREERLNLLGRSLAIRGMVTLVVVVVALWWTGDLRTAMIAQFIAWTLHFILHDARSARSLTPKKAWLPQLTASKLFTLTRLALPLGISICLLSLLPNLPRYAVEHVLGRYELGVFGALAYFLQVGQMVITSLGQTVQPRLAKVYSEGSRTRFRTLVVKLLLIALVLGSAGVGGAALLGKPIVTLIYSAEYAKHLSVLVVLMVAGVGVYFNFLAKEVVIATRLFRPQVPIAAASVASMGFFCFLWVEPYGLLGAAWAWVSATAIEASLWSLLLIYALTQQPRPKEVSP